MKYENVTNVTINQKDRRPVATQRWNDSKWQPSYVTSVSACALPSSELSGQSFSPSRTHSKGMQRPVAQVKAPGLQAFQTENGAGA